MTADALDPESAASFAEMAVRLHDEPGVEETVELVLEYALSAVGADFAGVTFTHAQRKIETVAATDPLIGRLDQLQVRLGRGPCLEVVDLADGLVIADTDVDQRWPVWAMRASEAGVRSFLSVRLNTYAQLIGSLNLYGRKPAQFDDDDLAVAHVLGRHASVALAAARSEANLYQAVDARKVIGQAMGILMERYAIDSDRAFAVLRRYSQNHNLKLRAVAERLIGTGELPD